MRCFVIGGVGGVHDQRMLGVGGEVSGDFIHPAEGRFFGGMGTVFAAIEGEAFGFKIARGANMGEDKLVDAGVVLPVGRSNPDEGDVAKLADDVLHVGRAFLDDVADE